MHHVNCKACETTLGPIEEFFFLKKSEDEAMFVLTLCEKKEKLFNRGELAADLKRRDIHCAECCRRNRVQSSESNGQNKSSTIGIIDLMTPGADNQLQLSWKMVVCKTASGDSLTANKWPKQLKLPDFSDVKQVRNVDNKMSYHFLRCKLEHNTVL